MGQDRLGHGFNNQSIFLYFSLSSPDSLGFSVPTDLHVDNFLLIALFSI